MEKTGDKLFGSEHEINFWKGFVLTDRFLNEWCGPGKTAELNEGVAQFIHLQLPAKVLDIGAGACSILNGLVPNADLVTADLLGDEYDKFVDYKGLGVNKPRAIAGEDLKNFFNENEFDIVFIRNAFDHSQNPREVFESMKYVCKPGGHIIISGFENEAIAENWQGFHQWNIFLDESRIVIDGKEIHDIISEEKVIISETIELEGGKKWMNWICQK